VRALALSALTATRRSARAWFRGSGCFSSRAMELAGYWHRRPEDLSALTARLHFAHHRLVPCGAPGSGSRSRWWLHRGGWSPEDRDDMAIPAPGRRPAVTLRWPAAAPEHLAGCRPWLQPDLGHGPASSGNGDRGLPDPPGAGMTDPRLIGGVADITAMIAAKLDDGASATEVMPVIRETAQRWLERQVRAGILPASAGSAIDELARAVHDQRYELGPVTAYLRDPQVENVDINGCDQNLADSPTYEPPGCVPVSVDRLTSTARRLRNARLCRVPANAMYAAAMTDSVASKSGHV
jgi:hypothetical protein